VEANVIVGRFPRTLMGCVNEAGTEAYGQHAQFLNYWDPYECIVRPHIITEEECMWLANSPDERHPENCWVDKNRVVRTTKHVDAWSALILDYGTRYYEHDNDPDHAPLKKAAVDLAEEARRKQKMKKWEEDPKMVAAAPLLRLEDITSVPNWVNQYLGDASRQFTVSPLWMTKDGMPRFQTGERLFPHDKHLHIGSPLISRLQLIQVAYKRYDMFLDMQKMLHQQDKGVYVESDSDALVVQTRRRILQLVNRLFEQGVEKKGTEKFMSVSTIVKKKWPLLKFTSTDTKTSFLTDKIVCEIAQDLNFVAYYLRISLPPGVERRYNSFISSA
jgi:hypothetical protein